MSLSVPFISKTCTPSESQRPVPPHGIAFLTVFATAVAMDVGASMMVNRRWDREKQTEKNWEVVSGGVEAKTRYGASDERGGVIVAK